MHCTNVIAFLAIANCFTYSLFVCLSIAIYAETSNLQPKEPHIQDTVYSNSAASLSNTVIVHHMIRKDRCLMM